MSQQKNIPPSDAAEAIRSVLDYTDSFRLQKGRSPGVYIQTFGCQQNEADSERLAGLAAEMGYEYTDDPDAAELIIFNTCAVREHAELKALSLTGQLKHKKAANPELIVCICGCMVAQEHRLNEIKNRYPYVDFLFGTASPQQFPVYLSQALKKSGRAFYPDPEDGAYPVPEGLPVRRESSFRAWVSIMYGCNNFCTYCVVPYVRGRERSREPAEILSEIRQLAAEGYKEITLLGQNVNSYGKDRADGYDFADLLEDICRIPGDYWIRFMTSHPKDASDKLIDVIARHSGEDSKPKIAKAFHLPLQAGSDRVLKRMNRRYTAEAYEALTRRLRDRVPGIALSTDIIVGFPQETEEDFEETLRMLEKIRYDAFFSFIYSKRKGTPAAEMEGQVPEEVKSERFRRLLAVQNAISHEKNQAYIGTDIRVLVEGYSKNDPDRMTGRNEQNRLVHFPKGEESIIGTFQTVHITGADTYTLSGRLS